MQDARYDKLASLLVNYSTSLQRGEKVLIESFDAPEETHYRPVWQPGPAEPGLDTASAGIRSVIWATGFRADFSFEFPSSRRAA